MSTRDDFLDAIERDGIEFIFAMFVDLHGKPCAKLVPVSAVDQLLESGAGFAGFAAGAMGQVPSSPDILALPDLGSYTPAPWQPGLAIVQCDPYCQGEPWPYAPRVILRRQIDQLAHHGLVLKVGAEAEYFLVRRSADGGIEVADPLDRAAMPCYDARALTRMYDHLTTVSRCINALGWANYANDHEDANGQFEQNFAYADPMTTADRVIVFRYMVHALAAQAGMLATFMPKPFSNLTGNGLHLHLSLWDHDGSELFFDESDVRGLGDLPLRVLLHRGPVGPRPGARPRSPARRSTPTSVWPAPPPTRGRRGHRSTPPTAATTGPTCCGSPTPVGWRTGAWTAPPTRTWPSPR